MKTPLFVKFFIYSLLYFDFLTLFVYDFSNVRFKPSNVMSFHELKEHNKAGDDEVDDY